VKVGRAALDEDAIRLIEENNPEVDFDWTRILKGEPPEPPRREAPPREFRSARKPPARGSRQSAEPETAQPLPEVEVRTDVAGAEQLPAPPAMPGTAEELPPTPAHARLGPEGVLRLRGRYAELLTRIAERVPDPGRRDELKAEAERLNPDSWVTDEEVRIGLEQYETVFASLREVVGRRRRRHRRRAGRQGSESPAPRAQEEGPEKDLRHDEESTEGGDGPGSDEL
jgi:hypothetical protein